MVNNADSILFRASSAGFLMVEPRSKSETIAEGTKTHLVDVFVSNKYGRNTEIHSKYTNKGLQVEEDSITLYSRVTKKFYKKNEDRISNEFICGTPDLYEGESIENADLIIDVKSSWDIFTFFRSANDSLNKRYYWQLQAYMALTGAQKAKLVYCLVNTPDSLIQDEKSKLRWKMNVIDPMDKDYQQACDEIDRLSIYDDIPMSERYFEVEIERNEEDIARLYGKVIVCREWMNANLFKLKPELLHQ